MKSKFIGSLAKLTLTLSCQSGRNVGALASLLVLVLGPLISHAAPGWAHQTDGFQSNGAVTVKSLSGGAYAATRNPAGAVAKANQSASTQPPTVIIQATASLPIKAIGDSCTINTSGTAPNQTAGEGTAIVADRSSLLTCQAGVWKGSTSCPIGTKLYPATGALCISTRSASASGLNLANDGTALIYHKYCAGLGLQPVSSGILAALFPPNFDTANTPQISNIYFYTSDSFNVLATYNTGSFGERPQQVFLSYLLPTWIGYRSQVGPASNSFSGGEILDVLCYR